MSKEDFIEAPGIVTEAFPNAFFNVQLTDTTAEHTVFAQASGKIRKNHIRILLGDKVIVQISPLDLTRGRIIRRLS